MEFWAERLPRIGDSVAKIGWIAVHIGTMGE